MRIQRQWSKAIGAASKRGFALVVTVSLMVLLTVLAVGLLTLSSIALRASGQGEALAAARANACLALMLAVGELQRSAGADQRVTARADLLDADIANPRLTGVWESWEIKATAPPPAADYEKPAKDAKFRGWLVSHTDPEAARQVEFASQAPSAPVTLWGKGTLGDKAPAKDHVSATKVPLAAGPGALAWAVLDEGIKARINTPYVDAATSAGAKTAQLGAGERPGVEFIDGLAGLQRRMFEIGASEFATLEKGISRLNFAMAAQDLAPGARASLQSLIHDVTTQSVGLFTDTAHGGLKQDFHLLTNSTNLPAAYQAKGVYASRLGMAASAVPSDPRWESLHQFSRLYRDKIVSTAGVPVIKTQVPTGWQAATGDPPAVTVNRKPPAGVLMLPTIAKVQVVFSLVANDIFEYPGPAGATISPDAPQLHGPQGNYFRGTKYEYELDLQYTPIVTLHNPYNVALECSNVRIEFLNVPFAATVYRNGIAQNTDLAPIDQMFYTDNELGKVNKRFGINLKSKSASGVPDSTTFRLLPGEVKMFSPYLDPNHTWWDEQRGNRIFWDFDSKDSSNMTQNIVAIPGWRGDGIGFVLDWWNPAPMRIGGPDKEFGRWAGCIGLARDDQIHIVFAPLSVPGLSNNKFIVQMTATPPGSSTPVTIEAMEFDYESPTGLQDSILGKGGTLRYPKTGTVGALEMLSHQKTAIKDNKNAKPFCIISAQAKSTSGGRDASKEDGRLATKPWCFAHANIGASSQKVVSEHFANHSHEIDFQRLDKGTGTANLLQIDQQDRANFISGHTPFNGTKFGGQYDIPLGPVQTLASLNGANPGGSSGYLPRFARPIGNSWAHPLLSPSKLMEVRPGGNYLDHSFLLNLALYDNFYFSGLAAQSGPFAGSKATATLASDFKDGMPLDDPRMILHRPLGRPADDLATEIAKPDAYGRIASWQLMAGPFNVNSTSVVAWKAMLASIHDAQALVNQLNKAGNTSKLSDLADVGTKEARISRFRLPASASAADGADPKDGYWLGPREFSDAQLQTLAENIVKQVRLRGPFLSLAEFVNRRLGSGETAQRGALQQAIDDSNLNQGIANAANAGFEIPAQAVANYKYVNPAAGAGPSYQGAPGFLTQAELLNVLGNAATPRSDTFTIRAYGESRGPSGKILATATCEAVVQRYPEWVDSADPVEAAPAALTSTSNKTFGRRFLITSLRWLNPKEI